MTENPRVPSSILGLGTNQIKGLGHNGLTPVFLFRTYFAPLLIFLPFSHLKQVTLQGEYDTPSRGEIVANSSSAKASGRGFGRGLEESP